MKLITRKDSLLNIGGGDDPRGEKPKKKHHKRRIVQPELAGQVRRALADGGVWRIATDIEDYALHVHEASDTDPFVFSKEGLIEQ